MKPTHHWLAKPGQTLPFARLLGAVLRFRIEHDREYAEAEANGVAFTPICWWWNADADEYVLTMWDTND